MAPVAVTKTAKTVPVTTRVTLDEELWFGTANVKAAEDAAAASMAATAGTVIGAKPFPESARRLAELSMRENSHVAEMVQVLELDPALSAKLLRVVNSAGFGLRQRCTSVRHAITLVGSKQLYQIATTAAVLDLFDAESGPAVAVLEHSAVVGAFCRYLGSHLSLPSEDLFTAGVLHDIGKLMFLETFGGKYHEIFDQCQQQPETLYAAERAEYGFDHGVLGAHVLKTWNIPNPIPKIVAWHHEPTRAYESSPLHASLVQTLRLADILDHSMARGTSRAEIGLITQHEAASYLDISEAQLDAMWQELTTLRQHTLAQRKGGPSDETPSGDESVARVRTSSKVPGSIEKREEQFPCARCGSPSFGSACPACNGYVCPGHPIGETGWCSVCEDEYAAFVNQVPFAIRPLHFGIASISGSLLGGGVGILASGSASVVRGLVSGFCIAVFGVGAALLARRSYIRARFVRSRPTRTPPSALLIDAAPGD